MHKTAFELGRSVVEGVSLHQRANSPRVLRHLRELLDTGPQRRPLKNWLSMIGAILAALLIVFVTPSGARAADLSNLELAREAMEDNHYGEALKHYQRAAELGERDARRALGLILLYGEALLGKEVMRQKEMAWRWLRLAADQGCEVSTFMLRKRAEQDRQKS